MYRSHVKKIGSLFAVVAVLFIVLSSLPLPPKRASSAGGPKLFIIYGHVSAAGTVQDGSGNFTVTPLGGGVYDIAFTATPGFTSPPSVVAMPETTPPYSLTMIVDTPTASGVRVRANGRWGLVDIPFAFIAIGQSSVASTVNVIYGSFNGGQGGYGTPGAMVNRGSGGWTSYLASSQPTYQIAFAPGVFSQTPTVVASPEVNGPVDCLSYDSGSVSAGGATIRNMHNGCIYTTYAWSSIDFIAVGAGAAQSPNLAIAQGTWTRNGISYGPVTLNPGSTGISTVSNGSAGWPSQTAGFTVNFSPDTFAQTPVVVTNVSAAPGYAPNFCAGPYAPSPWSTSMSFTGIPGSWTCTYGDDRSGVYAHSTFGATMIAVGYTPVQPLLASCTATGTNVPYGTPAQFTANPSGGRLPYTYQWTYPPGAASCGNASTCTTNALTSSFGPGTFALNVVDGQGSQSGAAACPGVNITLPSVVTSSFSGTIKQLTFTTTTPPAVRVSATVFVRNAGSVVGSTMDWFCAVDPSYVLPPGLTVDTSQCIGFGLRGGAPTFP